MGNCLSCTVGGGAWSLWSRTPNRDITLLLLGLDGAGKSTILANLIGEETEDVTPTIGFANAATTLGSSHVTLYDVGGGPRIRGIWKNYYAQSHGIVFVVDATSTVRLDEAKQVLSGVLQEERVMGKPLLIFANKQDQTGALTEDEVRARLELDSLLGEHRQNARVIGCTGVSSDGSGVVTGVEWVVREVRRRWEEMEERVRTDRERQRERQERERAERSERVRKIREERERLAALQRAENGDQPQEKEEDEDSDMPANPFKPISQVVAEATEREAKAKKQKAEKVTQERAEKVTQESGKEVGEHPPSGSEQHTTRHIANDNQTRESAGDGVATGVAASSPPSSEAVSSGLSDSTETLTQVTVPSKDGSLASEGLGVVTTPTTQSVAMATTQQPTVQVLRNHPSSTQVAESSSNLSVPKKSRWNFLSRLKSRNKIAPSTQPLPTTTSAEPPTPLSSLYPPPSVNEWLSPSMNRGHSTEEVNGRQGTGGERCEEEREKKSDNEGGLEWSKQGKEVVLDPFHGLPELPKNRQTLPPLRVTKRPPGLENETFTTAEDIDVLALPSNLHTVPPQAVTS